MDTWRIILQSTPARGAWNMAVDEAILAAAGRGESLPTLRLYAWEPACLSLGYAQPVRDVDRERLHARGWDLVRRPTGGRAVLHVDELTYSVTGPLDEPRLAGTVLESYNRLAAALTEALRTLGLPVQVQEHSKSASRTANPVCFEMPSTYEITVNGKKLVGSAQARRKEGVLQHGSLPLTGDLRRILQALAYPDEESRTRAAERLLRQATTVETALGRVVAWEEAAEAFVSAFRSVLALDLQPAGLTRQETSRAEELMAAKYTSPNWTENKKS
ncbi:MAG: lipoate--protein ligase family protein [Chloroflexota bacterium]